MIVVVRFSFSTILQDEKMKTRLRYQKWREGVGRRKTRERRTRRWREEEEREEEREEEERQKRTREKEVMEEIKEKEELKEREKMNNEKKKRKERNMITIKMFPRNTFTSAPSLHIELGHFLTVFYISLYTPMLK